MNSAPAEHELNQTLQNFKDEQFAQAQYANALADLGRFDGTNTAVFAQGIALLNNLPEDALSLLDVGCGIGLYGKLFRDYGTKKLAYSGCDFSAAMLEYARQLNPGCDFRQSDARALPYADGRFDVVWISALLEHVPEYEQVIKEAARVARKHVLLHRLFLHKQPTITQILTTKPGEYPYAGFQYPRTIRNTDEFTLAVSRFGRVNRLVPWAIDPSRGINQKMHSCAVELRPAA